MFVSRPHTLDLDNELQPFPFLVVLILSLALDLKHLLLADKVVLKHALRICKNSMQVPVDLLAEAKAAAKDAQEEDMDAD